MKVYFILLVALCYNVSVKSQDTASVRSCMIGDSIFSNHKFITFLESQSKSWALPINFDQIENLNIINGLTSNISSIETRKYRSSIGIEHSWNYGDTLSFGTLSNRNFTRINSELAISFFKLPIILSANIMFNDNVWQRNLTTYKVKIDYQAVTAQNQKKMKQESIKYMIKKWSKDDLVCWINKTKWDVLYHTASHPEFKKTKIMLENTIDSLESLDDRISDSLGDRLDFLKTEYSYYKTVDSLFLTLLHYYRHDNSAFHKAELLNKSFNNIKSEIQVKYESERATLSSNLMRKLIKFKKSIKKFDLGNFDLSGFDLTVNSLLLNGVRAEFVLGKYYNEFAHGRRILLSNSQTSGFNSIYDDNDLNRNITYYRFGLGNPDSNFLHFSLLHILDNFNRIKTNNINRVNDVLSMSGHKVVSKSISMDLELTYANYYSSSLKKTSLFMSSNSDTTVSLNEKFRKLAFKASFYSGKETNKGVNWKVYYTYIGDKYISLANPYLINGRQLIGVELRKQFKLPRIFLRAVYDRQIATTQSTDFNPTFSQTGLTLEGAYRYHNHNKFTLKFMPRYFLISNSIGESSVARYDMYAIQNLLQGSSGISHWFWLISLTNINMTIQTTTQAQYSGFNYINSQFTIRPNKKYSFIGLSNVAFEKRIKTFYMRELTLQLECRLQFQKSSLAVGIQNSYFTPNRSGLHDVQLGLSIGGELVLQRFRVGIHVNARESILSENKTNIFIGQIFFRNFF